MLNLETGLARTKAKNLLAITLSATVLTLGVMFGVWLLSVAVKCADIDRGFGICLRADLVEQGVLDQSLLDLPRSSDSEQMLDDVYLHPLPPKYSHTHALIPFVVAENIMPEIEAIEIEKNRIYIAGKGPVGHQASLYIDDILVGSALVIAGRWLIELENRQAPMLQILRVEVRAPNAENIISSAPIVMRTYRHATLDLGNECTPISTDIVASERGAIPMLHVLPVGEAAGERYSSGQIIVREGDDIWSIANRAYSDAKRHIHIFEANENKLKNPDWLVPGQVFFLPPKA